MSTNNPIGYLTSRLWKYSAGNRRQVVLYVCLFLIANIFGFLEPLAIAKLIDILQNEGISAQTWPRILFYLCAPITITIAFWAFHGPARVIENRNAFLAKATYKKYLLDGVMAFPLEWHTGHHSGDTIDKIEKGTNALYRFGSHTFDIISAIVALVSAYIVLTYFNIHAGYLVLIMTLGTVAMVLRIDKVLIKQYTVLLKNDNAISEKVFDVISNITTVIILRVEKMVSSSMYKKIMEPLKLFVKNNKINETKWFLVSLSTAVMTVLVLGTHLYREFTAGSVIMISTIYLLYEYVGRINGLFYRFAYMYGDIVQQKASVMNAEEIANEFSRVKKAKAISLGKNWKKISISDLSFSYHTEAGADLHLEHVDMTIPRNSRIALIGASGSGKTTFLKVLRDLYHPRQGKISLDGKQLPGGFQSISNDIALIPQDPEIFSTTVRENITFGLPYEKKTIAKYSDMARFTDVVKRLPKKLESSMVEKGVNLSGGEKQRLALTRGLLACEDKSIVLLDEPTSSVDMRNELHIFENIFAAFKDKTIIASVHRLHLLPLFDTVILFQHGKIIASGTHSQLLASSPEFQELWKKYQEMNEHPVS